MKTETTTNPEYSYGELVKSSHGRLAPNGVMVKNWAECFLPIGEKKDEN